MQYVVRNSIHIWFILLVLDEQHSHALMFVCVITCEYEGAPVIYFLFSTTSNVLLAFFVVNSDQLPQKSIKQTKNHFFPAQNSNLHEGMRNTIIKFLYNSSQTQHCIVRNNLSKEKISTDSFTLNKSYWGGRQKPSRKLGKN